METCRSNQPTGLLFKYHTTGSGSMGINLQSLEAELAKMKREIKGCMVKCSVLDPELFPIHSVCSAALFLTYCHDR